MTPQQFVKNCQTVGTPAAYGHAIGRVDWGEGMGRLVPNHMQDGVARYILYGIPPGNFLTALLSNDLMGACRRADDVNLHALPQWARFLINFTPSGCYGSPERFDDWINARGVLGQPEDVA